MPEIKHDVPVSTPAGNSHTPVPGALTPNARRAASASWRDPRLVVGVVIVALSVLVGVNLFSGADDTVSVWATTADLRSGTTVGADDLQR